MNFSGCRSSWSFSGWWARRVKGTAVVSDGQSGLSRLLTAAETAAPVDAVDVVAEDLRRRFEATKVSFLIVDLTGKAVARLSTTPAEGGREAERIPLFGSVYEEVIRTQRVYQEATGQGHQVIAPVTNRGDAIGLLELLLPTAPGEDALHAVGEAAHALAYVVIANGRFTDLYTWGKRSRPPTLAAEIQYQLLPPALSCEAAQFTLCGNLEPSEGLSGDTFDYSLDRDTLHVSVTDPMGHDLDAALAATVLVSALRGARRAGAGLADQAHLADQALADHGRGHATGQLLRINLHTGQTQLVNAGHPGPCACATEPRRRSPARWTIPSGCPCTRPTPTASRTSICATVTVCSCSPTACSNVTGRGSTCTPCWSAPGTCTRGRPRWR